MSTTFIVDTKWYSGGESTIGIVLLKRPGGHRAYIGIGNGNNEMVDQIRIRDFGAKFPNEDGAKLWPNIKEWAP